MRTRARRTFRWSLALVAGGGLLLSSCADFDNSAAGQSWSPAPELTPEAGPQPELPGDEGTGAGPAVPRTSQTPIPPPQGCKDFDKAVIATCLDTVAAVAAMPDGQNALAGERKSGRVFLAVPGAEKQEIAKLEVDPAGDGGLTGLTPSPTYTEDRLVFAYVTTAEDNRVVRFAEGQPAKPVLTGIPKGPTGNRGTLTTDAEGALLVATGDAGDPAAAADPNSLAGKVLRIDPAGRPAKGNPKPDSAVLASGLHAPGGLCQSADGSRLWVTDRAQGKDVLHRVDPGSALEVPAWTWPDQPGVAGCADLDTAVVVATATAGNLQSVPTSADGAVTGKPVKGADGKSGRSYGLLGGMDLLDPQRGTAVVGTLNKDGGKPVSSDDRVVIISLLPGPGGNGKD